MGGAEGESAEHPVGGLVLHVTREAVHHGAAACPLRDPWLHQPR